MMPSAADTETATDDAATANAFMDTAAVDTTPTADAAIEAPAEGDTSTNESAGTDDATDNISAAYAPTPGDGSDTSSVNGDAGSASDTSDTSSIGGATDEDLSEVSGSEGMPSLADAANLGEDSGSGAIDTETARNEEGGSGGE